MSFPKYRYLFRLILISCASLCLCLGAPCSTSPGNSNCNQSMGSVEQLMTFLNLDSDEMRSTELEIRVTNKSEPSESLHRHRRSHWNCMDTFSNLYSITVRNIGIPNEGNDEFPKPGKNVTRLIVLVIPTNTSVFYSALNQIVEEDQDNNLQPSPENLHDYHRHWNPKYFVLYPTPLPVSTSEDFIPPFFNDTNFGNLIQSISVNEDIYIVTHSVTETDVQISLWELYSIVGVRFVKKVPLSSGCRINWPHFNHKFDRRRNFGNAKMKVTAPADYLYEAEIKFGHAPNGDVIFENGTSVSMLRFLEKGLNFTVKAMEGSWTYETEDNRGILGGGAVEIINGKADISIEQTTITSKRRKQVRFLHPTFFDGVDAFFVQPPVSTARNLYLAPFNLDLWLAMFGTWLLLLIAMKVCVWVKSLRAEIEEDDKAVLEDLYLWAVGAMCQQGWHIQPVSMSLRIIFVIGYLSGLLCFVAFSAAIVSLLSVKVVPIKSINDLTRNSFHMFASPNSTSLDGIAHLIKNQSGYPASTIVSEPEAMAQLKKSKSAILTYPDIFYTELRTVLPNITDKDVCETYSSVPVSSTPLRSGMMVNLKSPYVEYLNCLILLMRERGLNLRYIAEYYRKTQTRCLINTTGFKQALGILDVISAFYILVAGHVLSFAILSVEFTVGKSITTTVHTIRQ